MAGWEWCWKFPTYNVPDLFAFFLPVLISKQLQQTLLPFPIALAVTVFCYDFHAALVCACLLICLVKLLRGMKMQTEIGAFPFSEERNCISISACTRKANRKTDTFCVFRGGGGERVNLLLLLQQVFLFTGVFCRGKEQGGVEKRLFSPSSFSRNFPFQTRRKCSVSPSSLFQARYTLEMNLCLRAVIPLKNKGYFLHIGIFLKEEKGQEKGKKIKGSNVSLSHIFLFWRLSASLVATASFHHGLFQGSGHDFHSLLPGNWMFKFQQTNTGFVIPSRKVMSAYRPVFFFIVLGKTYWATPMSQSWSLYVTLW